MHPPHRRCLMLIAVVLAVIAAAWTTGCATPVPFAPAGPGVAADGAEAGSTGVDTNLLVVQPGGKGVQSPVRNEDRVSNAQNAPVYLLDVSGMGGAQTDPLVKSLAADLAAENDPAAKAALRAELAARLQYLRETAEASNLPSLERLCLAVVHIQVNGTDVAKLSPEAAQAAAAALAASLAPAVEGAK